MGWRNDNSGTYLEKEGHVVPVSHWCVVNIQSWVEFFNVLNKTWKLKDVVSEIRERKDLQAPISWRKETDV